MAKKDLKDELIGESLDESVGFRMTTTERVEMEAFCKEHKYKQSKFIRYAVKKAMQKKCSI